LPEHVKSLIEERNVFVTMHEQATDRVIEITLVSNLDEAQRLNQVHHPARVHIQTEAAQQAPEQDQVVKELA
jgi:hypothetical protein